MIGKGRVPTVIENHGTKILSLKVMENHGTKIGITNNVMEIEKILKNHGKVMEFLHCLSRNTQLQ